MQLQDYFELLKSQLIQAGDELVGLNVFHKSLGYGFVSRVEKRESQKSLIEIKFSNGEKATFNQLSEDFFQIPSQTEQVTTSIIEFLNADCKEILEVQEKLSSVLEQIILKNKLLFEKMQHYNVANFYNSLIERSPVSETLTVADRKKVADISVLLKQSEDRLNVAIEVYKELLTIEQIIQKIDLSLDLDALEIEGLSNKKLFNLLATASYRSYKKTNDLWTLVQACKYLRWARMPQRVIELTQEFTKGTTSHLHPKILSAIYTTRGAAFKDISDFDNAKEMANRALSCEESKYSHNLMGAISYWSQEFSKGDAHFHRASELGSTTSDRITEIRMARHKLDAAGKAKLQAHLDSINLKI